MLYFWIFCVWCLEYSKARSLGHYCVKYINDVIIACEVFTLIFSDDDMNPIYRKKQDELLLISNFLENIPKWLSPKTCSE